MPSPGLSLGLIYSWRARLPLRAGAGALCRLIPMALCLVRVPIILLVLGRVALAVPSWDMEDTCPAVSPSLQRKGWFSALLSPPPPGAPLSEERGVPGTAYKGWGCPGGRWQVAGLHRPWKSLHRS